MSSSGLKLRDTRELLANPDQLEDPKNPSQSSAKAELEIPVAGSINSLPVSAKFVTSMSPSLAMANAEASPSPQEKDGVHTEAATTQSTRRESEPVPKKRRLLEATEPVHEDKECGQQQNETDDILAQACFVVGIDSDLADSVVEEPLPLHQTEINGEQHRLPENYSYVRGVRPLHPGIQMPPRLRHSEELIIQRQIHPAFRPPSNGAYGVELRPPYNQQYALQHRVPMHPGERPRYYAVPHYRGRYPYPGPPGSIPPPHQAPVLRPMPPNGPHERHVLVPHTPPGYPYDPQRFLRPSMHPQTSPLPHESRKEPLEMHQTPPGSSEVLSPNPRHQEISYRWPLPHDPSYHAVYPSEQLPPTVAHHPYPRAGPIPVQSKQHTGNSHAHPEDPRPPHPSVHEVHVPRISPGILPPTRYPLPRSSPHELSCRNPFELPEPQGNQNILNTPEATVMSPSQDRPCTNLLPVPIERDKQQATEHSKLEANVMEGTQSTITIDKTPNSTKPRKLREPPTPCVELIPIGIPPRDNKKTMAENISKRIHDPLPPARASPKVRSTQNSQRNKKTNPPEEASQNTEIFPDPSNSEGDKLVKTKKKKKINSPLPADEDNSNQKNEPLNNIPKRSFRKRWLDNKQDSPASKRQLRSTDPKSPENKIKPTTIQESTSTMSGKTDDIEIIAIEHTKAVTTDTNVNKNSPGSDTKIFGPGQLHRLHSSSYQSQNRPASEPPTGTPIPPNSSQALSNRPASLPGANQQSRRVRAQDESQRTENHLAIRKEKEPENVKDKDENDSAFIARLNLVLNDLISVPEATKLQHLTCPVDELLASLVQRRGAVPSEDPNPRQRLRKDFLVLVKLCMPPNLIEDWGWDKCTPEEILDELIKVTNNGIDSIIGNAKHMNNQDKQPAATSTPILSHSATLRPPPLLPSSPSQRTIPPSPQNLQTSHPPPVVQISVKPSIPSNHQHMPLPPNHTYPPNYKANPVLQSPQQVLSPSLSHPPMVPHHPDISPHHAPSYSPVSPSTHPSMIPRHPSLSPHGTVPHSPNHPAISPNHRLPALSQSPISPHPQIAHPSTHTSPTAHHPMPVNHHSQSPHHPIPHPASHSPLSPHQPMSLHSSHQPVPPHHRIMSHSPSNHHPESWNSYRHPVPLYQRQTSVSSNQSDTSGFNEENVDDEVFSPKAKEPPTPVHRSQIKAQGQPPQQLHPHEPVHEGTPTGNHQVHRMHPGYSQSVYARPPNSAQPQQIPLSVVHYSQQGGNPQMAQQLTEAPHSVQNNSHYPNEPQHPPHVHNPTHYPRGAYPQPYAYAYYHPNNPHYPSPPHIVHPSYRPPYRPSNVQHPYPQNLPYNPSHMPPRNPTSHNPVRNPTSQSPVRLVAQTPVPLTTNDWNGAEGERVEVTPSPIKPSA